MSLPSLYERSQSSSSFQYSQGSVGPSDDSGFKDSPLSNSRSLAQDVPPPVRLDTHPSFRKQRSVPVPRSSASPSGSFGAPSQQSYSHSVDTFNDDEMFDERAMSRQPHDDGHYEENEESGSGQFRMNSDRDNYIKMTQALAGLKIPRPVVPSNYDVPRPVVPSNYDVPPLFCTQSGESLVPSPASPSSNCHNSGPLPTIQEAPETREQLNVSAASKTRDEDFVVYHPNYDNAEIRSERQRDSCETYQNVPLIDEDLPQQPFRSLTSNMEKGQYTPPKNKNGPHLHYAQRQSSTAVSPPGLPPRVPVVCPTSRLVTHHHSSLPPYPLIIKETSAYLTEAETGKLIIFIYHYNIAHHITFQICQ